MFIDLTHTPSRGFGRSSGRVDDDSIITNENRLTFICRGNIIPPFKALKARPGF